MLSCAVRINTRIAYYLDEVMGVILYLLDSSLRPAEPSVYKFLIMNEYIFIQRLQTNQQELISHTWFELEPKVSFLDKVSVV